MYHTRLRHEVNRVNFPPLLRSLETFLSLEGVIESESETDTNIQSLERTPQSDSDLS